MSAERGDAVIALLTEIRNELRFIRKTMPVREFPPRVATADELDGQYGDPTIKYQPKRLPEHVEDVRQKRMSELSPRALEVLIETLEYFARKNDEDGELDAKGRLKSSFARRDAALARGWLARKRGPVRAAPTGVKPPPGAGDAWEEEEQAKATGTGGDDY